MSSHDHRTPWPPVLGALGGAALTGYLFPGLAGAWPALRGALGIEDRTASGRGYALTFDDGPHPRGTPAILEILAQARVIATFFLVGEQVRRAPDVAREITAAGHGIALHCDRHRNLLRLTPRQVREDLGWAQATIEDVTGRSPGLYRPPYGLANTCALLQARARGWRTLLWSDWGCDWKAGVTPESIAARVTRDVEEGSVLLLHDADDYSAPGSWLRTAAALPRVLETLAERGLQAVEP
jgi:peptidoglycan/xylan/chitin deacetylase (PgdA/CDA1 family)